jgi:hypothetical protein
MPQHQFDDLVAVLARDAGLPRRVLLRRVVMGLLGGGLVSRAGGAASAPSAATPDDQRDACSRP